MDCQIKKTKLCVWFSNCTSNCGTCKKCNSSALYITPGCVCDGCIGNNPFKVRK